MPAKIIGPELPTIPWEERLPGCNDVVWRYSQNPIIPRDLIPSSNSIFNSAVVPYGNEFRGVFRCDDKRRAMQLHAGRSKDGLKWEIENEHIRFQPAPGVELIPWEYGYDPRVCWIDDRYYVTWCNGFGGWPNSWRRAARTTSTSRSPGAAITRSAAVSMMTPCG